MVVSSEIVTKPEVIDYSLPPSSHELLPIDLRPIFEELLPYLPQEEWLVNPNGPMGADHSTDHPTRVLIWQEYLVRMMESEGYEFSDSDKIALRWFASIHDSQRFDDGYDLEHGIRSANWALTNLRDSVDDETLAKIVYLCETHVIEDEDLPEPLTLLGKIGKDADALDRALGRGVLDVNRLRLAYSFLLIPHGRVLHEESLKYYESNYAMNVLSAAVNLGYVR